MMIKSKFMWWKMWYKGYFKHKIDLKPHSPSLGNREIQYLLMKPEHKKYILKNLNKASIKQIARELKLKERKIKKFLERQKKKPANSKKEAKGPRKRAVLVISIALIIILGFVVYGNSLDGKFVWDDEALVKNNIYIKNWHSIANLFTKDVGMHIGADAGMKYNLYRPLQMLTYMCDYSFWKLNVTGYHLTNILLHIFTALAIYWLINILFGNRSLSLLTSVLFLVHPIHTEAVSYISGRADPLSLLLMLLSFIFYIKYLDRKKTSFYIPALLSYGLALLSRENSLILPVLFLLYHYSFKKKLRISPSLPIIGISALYLLLRLKISAQLTSGDFISSTTTLFQRIPGFFAAITEYIKLLLLPFNLHMEYGNKLFSFTDLRVLLGIAILTFLLIYAFRKRNQNNLIFFSVSWFIISLLPAANLYPINAYMAEHWLYLPSVGFFLILAYSLNSLYRIKHFKILSIGVITVLVVFYSYLTIKQNGCWREPILFYERTLKYAPDSPRVHFNLGNLYRDIGKKDEAIALYKQAIKLNPNYADAYTNFGKLCGDIGRHQEEISAYKKAIEINPYHPTAYNNLGAAYYDMGKFEEAIAAYKKAIELNPNYAEMHYNLGIAYADMGKYEEAIAVYKKALGLNPDYAPSHGKLAIAYYRKKQYDLAIRHCDRAIELGYKVDPEFLKFLKLYR